MLSLRSATTGGRNVIKAISFDIQGTLIHHKGPVEREYARLAKQVRLPNPPTEQDFASAFREAYAKTNREYPLYRYTTSPDSSSDTDNNNFSTRRWWRQLCKEALEQAAAVKATANTSASASASASTSASAYTDQEIDRFFRAVYQHYGSLDGYGVFPDAAEFLASVGASSDNKLVLGVTANCSTRTIDTTLPVLGLSQQMQFFTCSQEAGKEKPNLGIFNATFAAIQLWNPSIKKSEVLHVGSNVHLDYVAARQYGFSAIHLDRSKDSRVIPRPVGGRSGKAGEEQEEEEEDVHLDYHLPANTVTDLRALRVMLEGS